MVDQRIEPPIDWENDGIWVQNIAMVMLVPERAGAQQTTVKLQRGAEQELTTEEFERKYTAVDVTIYKPRFNPVRAVCLGHETRLVTDNTSTVVPPGDAILELDGGTVTTLPRHEFNCDYRIVGTGSKRPLMGPFQ